MDPLERWVSEIHSILATRSGDPQYAVSGTIYNSTDSAFYTFGQAYWNALDKPPPYVQWQPGSITTVDASVHQDDDNIVPYADVQNITARIVGRSYKEARIIKSALVYASQRVTGTYDFNNQRVVTRSRIGQCQDETVDLNGDQQETYHYSYLQSWTVEMPMFSEYLELQPLQSGSIISSGSISSNTISGSLI